MYDCLVTKGYRGYFPFVQKANSVPVTMEEENYDEFGNYIGPEINDSDETNETVSVEERGEE